ncbi:fumarate reductase subunit C [Aureimonas jatrophae]|uniref:Uncharacterized protein n=2 Tax=Aureimonas jatrophae TaxID=1166073 RepID=A0A1H0M6Z5_9HYPH|nr:fumarate reductase subunit C [Aureimonas jatrophae]SDO75870.1 hypothetical protein SAMN05192530_11284 [Aureimonas jatrophae]
MKRRWLASALAALILCGACIFQGWYVWAGMIAMVCFGSANGSILKAVIVAFLAVPIMTIVALIGLQAPGALLAGIGIYLLAYPHLRGAEEVDRPSPLDLSRRDEHPE